LLYFYLRIALFLDFVSRINGQFSMILIDYHCVTIFFSTSQFQQKKEKNFDVVQFNENRFLHI